MARAAFGDHPGICCNGTDLVLCKYWNNLDRSFARYWKANTFCLERGPKPVPIKFHVLGRRCGASDCFLSKKYLFHTSSFDSHRSCSVPTLFLLHSKVP